MDKNEILEYARKAYDQVYNNSEDVIVREAISRYSDSEDVTDYVESYQNIFKEGWVNFVPFRGTLNSYLKEDEKLTYTAMEEALADDFQVVQITNDKIGTTYKYIRPIEGHEGEAVPAEQALTKVLPELTDQQKTSIVSEIKRSSSSYEGHWISMVDLGASLKAAKIDYKAMGFPKLRDLLAQLLEYVELRVESPVKIYVHVIGDNSPNDSKGSTIAIPPSKNTSTRNEDIVIHAIKSLIQEGKTEGGEWVSSVYLAPAIKKAGLDYKTLGFTKFKPFLESLPSIELKQVSKTELNIRINLNPDKAIAANSSKNSLSKSDNLSPYERIVKYSFFPSKDKEINGFTLMLTELESKAKKEKWEYGSQKILQNYLLFTFERIQYEDS